MRSKAIFMALLAFAFGAQAVPVSIEQARSAAQAWVRGGRPGVRLGARLGTAVDRVSARKTVDGVSFYEVRLRNEQESRTAGTLIMSADTAEAPVIAFSSETVDLSNIDRRSPLWAFLSADVRLQSRQQVSARRQEGRWARLLDAAPPIHGDHSPAEIDDLRVDVLLKTKWGQSDISIEGGGQQDPCFNYYTPKNYVCGCVATATAQIMRYHCWPTSEVAVFTETCSVDGADTDLTTLGGVFDWENMPEKEVYPSVTGDLQCQAMGRLTYECGVAVRMQYAEDGSGAITAEVPPALIKRFGYANAQWFGNTSLLTGDESVRAEYIYPSLDAGYPVLFSIRGVSGGHAVVCDGYGYSTIDGEAVPYVHINMGWTGQNDWWYNLPEINTGDNPESFVGFDELSGVGYNIFPDKTGRIVSGRVLDVDGNPVEGAVVKIGDLETTTSKYGVYAFILSLEDFPRGTYTVTSASEDGKYIGVYDVTLSNSLAQNHWGCDIELAFPSVRVGTEIYSTLNHALAGVAEGVGDVVEILLPTELRRDTTVLSNCTITATNPVASASMVTCRAGASLTVGKGARVLFKNVGFANEDGSETEVSVASNGVAAVSDYVGIHSFKTGDAGGFELAGAITTAMYVDGPDRAAGAVFGTNTAVGAESCVNQIRNPYDEELGGTLVGSDLVWGVAPVPDVAAIVRLEQGGTSENFLSLGRLFGRYTGDAVITVFRDCPFTNRVTVSGSLSIVSENGAVVSLADESGFVMPAGTGLSIGNVILDGRGTAKVRGQFFAVKGGALTLESGAAVRGITCTGGNSIGGAILLESGALTMKSGSEIRNCRAEGDGRNGVYGGGIAAQRGRLNLLGGTIADCFAAKAGGGVYTATETVLGGDLRVEGNSSGSFDADDLHVVGKDNLLAVADEMSGAKVGVRHSTAALDEKGAVFATVEAAAPSDRAFFSDANERLIAQVVSNEISWQDVDPRICPEEDAANAVARIVRPDGTTSLWYSAADALEGAGDGCVVELLKDDVLARKATLPSAEITFRTAAEAGSGPLTLSRAVNCGIIVPSGASLTLTDVVLSGVVDLIFDSDSEEALLAVNGGSLCLGEGSEICDVYGDRNRAANAVVVWNGGAVVLDGGSIHDCVNSYVDDVKGVEDGCGAAILVEGEGSSAEFLSGRITDCAAARGGAVFVSDRATISVSGDVTISGNSLLDFETPSNLGVADLSSLVLVDALADESLIGYIEGVEGDVNVFGSVDGAYYAQAVASAEGRTALTNSAACFVHDMRHVRGVVATNGTDAALLVWSDAFVDEGGVWTFTDEDGVKYGAYGNNLPAPDSGLIPVDVPTAVAGLVYDGSLKTGVEFGEGYVLFGNTAINAGDYTATATPLPGCEWSDGTTEQKFIDWSIAKATYDMSDVVFTNVTYVCDGSAKSNLVEEATLPAGVSVTNYLNNGQTEVGTYTVTAQFGGDADNYEPIADMTATLTITEAPTPPPGPTPHWEVETHHPDPIAFRSIARVSDTEWTLVVTGRVEYCNYRLIWTKDLTKGFTETGKWEHAVGPAADPVWTTNVITTGGARFWRAEGADGTNMVYKTEE